MRVKSITLKNFCQHADRTVCFSDGLTAIIGPNGSGKSNCLGALRFLLTGDNPNYGKKAMNVREGMEPGDTAYVRGEFQHGPLTFSVQRNLVPASPTAIFESDSGVRIIGDKEVTAEIEKVLGITCDIINEIVIVAQQDIFGFLDKTPAKRGEFFQRMFHTDVAEQVHAALGQYLNRLSVPTIMVDKQLVRARMQTEFSTLQELQSRLQSFQSHAEIERNKEANAVIVSQHSTAMTLRAKLQDMDGQLSHYASERTKLGEAVEKQRAELQSLNEVLAAQEPQSDAARATLANLKNVQEQFNHRQSVIQQLNDAMRNRQALAAPAELSIPFASLVDIENAISQRNIELHNVRGLLTSFAGGVSECPTCGTPVATLQDKLAAATLRLPVLEGELSRLQQYKREFLDNEQARIRHEKTANTLDAGIESLRRVLADLPVVDEATGDKAELEKVANAVNGTRSAINLATHNLSWADQELGRLEGRIAGLQATVVSTNNELAALPAYTVVDAEKAAAAVAQWEQYRQARTAVERDIAVAEQLYNRTQQELQNIEKNEAMILALSRRRDVLTTVRSVFHKEAAPRFVAQRNLEQLQKSINEILMIFESAYRVEAADGLTFYATFPGGVRQPAERLSVGQKVILALAFRMSLNMMFAENIGGLYLDEPTSYLDDQHIRAFEPVLDRLRDYAASRGLQCAIVTHEAALAPLFDSVVQLN